MLEPSKPRPSSKTSSVQLGDGNREVLPQAGKVHEPQVDRLDVLLAAQCQHFFWSQFVSLDHHQPFPHQKESSHRVGESARQPLLLRVESVPASEARTARKPARQNRSASAQLRTPHGPRLTAAAECKPRAGMGGSSTEILNSLCCNELMASASLFSRTPSRSPFACKPGTILNRQWADPLFRFSRPEGEKGGHEQRANDERVQQHAERQREAQLHHRTQRATGHRDERAGHDDAATGDDTAGLEECLAQPGQRSAAALLLEYASDEVDVVVLADGDEDHEQEHGHFPVESLESVGIGPAEEQYGRTHRDQISEHDGGDQVQAHERMPQQQPQDEEDGEYDEDLDSTGVRSRHRAEVADPRRGTGIGKASALPEGVCLLRLPAEETIDTVDCLHGRQRKRIVVQHQFESGDFAAEAGSLSQIQGLGQRVFAEEQLPAPFATDERHAARRIAERLGETAHGADTFDCRSELSSIRKSRPRRGPRAGDPDHRTRLPACVPAR